ncbi:MAG TPA: metal ABC transporter ATP-binding protein [Myxococcota bacterium]|nr:metal ABC transporter ATP-binding protein [Myxococcota bacterium]
MTVVREGRPLLTDVSFDVEPGTIHFLVGPNGAGKSTLFAALLGMVDFAGRIRFHWRRSGRIGYVPQFFSVDRTLPLTVAEFLAMPRQLRPVCTGIGRAMRARLEVMLDRVGLTGYATRPLGALSGGELQRVLLANAIEPTPELLLLDEPATGLDESSARQFETTLLGLREASRAGVLMVSHDLAHARRIADRVTLLDRKVLRSGTPDEVLIGDLADLLAGATA